MELSLMDLTTMIRAGMESLPIHIECNDVHDLKQNDLRRKIIDYETSNSKHTGQ